MNYEASLSFVNSFVLKCVIDIICLYLSSQHQINGWSSSCFQHTQLNIFYKDNKKLYFSDFSVSGDISREICDTWGSWRSLWRTGWTDGSSRTLSPPWGARQTIAPGWLRWQRRWWPLGGDLHCRPPWRDGGTGMTSSWLLDATAISWWWEWLVSGGSLCRGEKSRDRWIWTSGTVLWNVIRGDFGEWLDHWLILVETMATLVRRSKKII